MKSKCDACGSEFLSENDFVGLCAPCLVSGTVGDRLTLQFGRSARGASDTETSEVAVDIDKLRTAFPELEILEPIRSGGMGAVFKARQTSLGRLVALKILDTRLSDAPEFQERFQREARTMALLNHPNIVTIHDFGERKGFHYLMMEYIDGCDVRQLMLSGELPPDDALELVPPICEALAFAHERGVIHRDVKPGNILVDIDGNVKMTDFGLAKLIHKRTDVSLTVEGAGMGTPHYIAPEQILDARSTDERSDIYALGVVVYEMLTGRVPSGNFPEPSSVMERRNKRLDRAVMRAMDQIPENRFSTVREFSDSLLGSTGEKSPFPSAKPRRKHRGRFRPLSGIALTLLLSGLVAGGAFLLPKPEGNDTTLESSPTGEPQQTLTPPPSIRTAAPRPSGILSRAGTLHAWSHGERKFDISPVKGIDDFLRVGDLTRSNYPWVAYRADQTVFSESKLLHGRKLIAATPTMFIDPALRLAHAGVDSPLYLPLSKRWGHRFVDVVEGIAAGLLLTEGGKVSILARDRWIEGRPEIVSAAHAAENIVRIEMKEETVVLVARDGSVVSWNGVLGLMPGPSGSPVIREAACGTNHAYGLTEDGKVVGWVHPEADSFTQPRYTEWAMQIPENLEKSIAIRAAKFVAAAQREDYTWHAWGVDFGTGLIAKINSLGSTGDLDFFLDTRGEAQLLWIEPKDE